MCSGPRNRRWSMFKLAGGTFGLIVLVAVACVGAGDTANRELVIQYDGSRGQAGLTGDSVVRLSFGGPDSVRIRLEHGPNIRLDSIGNSFNCASTVG